MITLELISYIKKQIQNNIPKDLIIAKLSEVGWHIDDINEGFLNIDKYREQLIDSNFLKIEKDPVKTENIKEEEIKIEKQTIEEKPKIWTPMNVPVKEISSNKIDITSKNLEVENINPKKEITSVEVQNTELPIREKIYNTDNQTQSNIDNSLKRKSIESFTKHNIVINPKYFNENKEIITTPKITDNSLSSIEKDNITKTDEDIISEKKSKSSLSDVNLPKIAMLSSYKSDLISIEKQKEKEKESSNPEKPKTIKWLIIGLIIVILIGISYIFIGGYINIKNLNIFSIKKDPRVLLLNNANTLSLLKSYKTETNLEIASPSFANISTALITGETISSNEKDSISINTLGVINQNNQVPIFDNFITVKSSLLQNYITLDIKSDGSDLFVSMPDLSQFMGENTPESSTVKINESQFEMIPSLFSSNVGESLKKLNLYSIVSNGMSSYINTDTLSAYNDLINNVEIIEKGTENIKGIDTYHYSVNADRQLVKKLLSKISDNFISDLSGEDKSSLDQTLGSVTIDSFDIWIGKDDNNIYQYSVVAGIPLSRIIGFDDKSIGDNQVKISWKTTYYDFDITNNLFIPEVFTTAVDYMNSLKEAQMKNDVSSFYELADSLFVLDKNYGTKSNIKGDCMAPVSGSLFSPTGHSKNSSSIISSISSLLNKILGTTNGAGFCSSTTKAWSFTVPISSNYDPVSIPDEGYKSFYCVDSTGAKETLTAFPTGNVCLTKTDSIKVDNQ